MADTAGVLYRAGTGKVDPWTKQQLICCETQSLIKAGANPCDAARQANCDVTTTLQTFRQSASCTHGADPCCNSCITQEWLDKLKAIFSDTGKTVLYIGIGAVLLLLVWNYITRPRI